jgi:hypothetical protein
MVSLRSCDITAPADSASPAKFRAFPTLPLVFAAAPFSLLLSAVTHGKKKNFVNCVSAEKRWCKKLKLVQLFAERLVPWY